MCGNQVKQKTLQGTTYKENYKTTKRKKRRHKEIKIHPLFTDWKNLYCQNNNPTHYTDSMLSLKNRMPFF